MDVGINLVRDSARYADNLLFNVFTILIGSSLDRVPKAVDLDLLPTLCGYIELQGGSIT